MADPLISSSELAALIDGTDPPIVIDVRRRADFAAADSIMPTALWGDPEHIAQWSKALARDRRVVVYCVKGASVGKTAAAYLCEQGFDAYSVEGGIRAWEESGRAVLPKAP